MKRKKSKQSVAEPKTSIIQPNSKNQINARKQAHSQIVDGEHLIYMNFKNERNLNSFQNSVVTNTGSDDKIMHSRSDVANEFADPLPQDFPHNLRDIQSQDGIQIVDENSKDDGAINYQSFDDRNATAGQHPPLIETGKYQLEQPYPTMLQYNTQMQTPIQLQKSSIAQNFDDKPAQITQLTENALREPCNLVGPPRQLSQESSENLITNDSKSVVHHYKAVPEEEKAISTLMGYNSSQAETNTANQNME